MQPGRLLHALARRCPDAMRERVLEPLIADLQHEWQITRSVRRLARGYVAFWLTFALCAGRCLARESVVPPSATFMRRAATAFVASLVATTLLQLTLMAARPSSYMTAFGLTIARALTLGVPTAILPALMYARTRGGRPSGADGFKIALIGVLLTMATFGWISPLGTRAYGMHIVSQLHLSDPHDSRNPAWHPERAVEANPGAKTWPELLRASGGTSVWAVRYRREAQERMALVVLSIVLAFAGWTLGGLGPERVLGRVAGWWALALLATQVLSIDASLVIFTLSTVLFNAIGPRRQVRLKPDTTDAA